MLAWSLPWMQLLQFVFIDADWMSSSSLCRYGYVTPDDVPILLEQHIGKGEVVGYLWRYVPFCNYTIFTQFQLFKS